MGLPFLNLAFCIDQTTEKDSVRRELDLIVERLMNPYIPGVKASGSVLVKNAPRVIGSSFGSLKSS